MDHSALQYLLNPGSELRTKQQTRYVTVLQEYPVRIAHQPGAQNANADTFSRLVASEAGYYNGGAGLCRRCGAGSAGPTAGDDGDTAAAPAAAAEASATSSATAGGRVCAAPVPLG